jgi:hypothetical protein
MSGPENFDVKDRWKQIAHKEGKVKLALPLELELDDIKARYSLDHNRKATLEIFREEESIGKVDDGQEGEVPTVFRGALGGPQIGFYIEDKNLQVNAEREMGEPTSDIFKARITISEIEKSDTAYSPLAE